MEEIIRRIAIRLDAAVRAGHHEEIANLARALRDLCSASGRELQ